MRVPSKLVLQGLVFFALIAVAGLFFARKPLNRFFKINRAYYHANLAQYREALAIAERLDPKGTQARTLAQVKMDALLQLGYPIGAIEAWHTYLDGRPKNDPKDYEPLYGFALLLGYRRGDAREHFTLSADPYAQVMASYLESPTFANYQAAHDETVRLYERRWLYVAILEWIEDRRQLAESGSNPGPHRLQQLVDRFPLHVAFKFDLGQAYLANGEIGLASSYLQNSFASMVSRYPDPAGAAIRSEWRGNITDDLVRAIYAGETITALRAMRALGKPLDLELTKPASILMKQDSLPPAAAFELATLVRSMPRLEKSLGESRFLAGEDWIEAFGGGETFPESLPNSIASAERLMDKGSRELSLKAHTWSQRLEPPAAEVGRRVVLIQTQSEPVRGVGASFYFDTGWKRESGYADARASWHAFDIPLTVGDSVGVTVRLRSSHLPGIDNPAEFGEGRKLKLLNAVLVDFTRSELQPIAAAEKF